MADIGAGSFERRRFRYDLRGAVRKEGRAPSEADKGGAA
jgi:hypothetical protein